MEPRTNERFLKLENRVEELGDLTQRLEDNVRGIEEHIERTAKEQADFREESRRQNQDLREYVIECIKEVGERFCEKLDVVEKSVPEEFYKARERERELLEEERAKREEERREREEERRKENTQTHRLIYIWTVIAGIGIVSSAIVGWISIAHG